MDEMITLAHGNGGRRMRALIEEIFAPALGNPDTQADATPIALPEGEIMVTTDGFTVQPVQFPGGDIGALCVHGVVNDLAVSGATPLYLTLAAL
ncbi:MAG: AIR synthase related protein, partial [Acidocella sp.]